MSFMEILIIRPLVIGKLSIFTVKCEMFTVKLCFNASSGLKGLNTHFIPNQNEFDKTD